MTSPWNLVDQTDEKDALESIGRMLVGTQKLQDEPGVVYSLAAQQAHPADAGAIDQFMQALDAERMVDQARATGTPIQLDDHQQTLLKQNNVPFQDVLHVPSPTATTPATATAPIISSQAQAKAQAQKKLKQAFGGGGGISGFMDSVGGAVKSAAGSVAGGLTKAYNFVQGVSHEGAGTGTNLSLEQAIKGDFGTHWDTSTAQDMTAAGYDPTSVWSRLAFDASGKKHTSLSTLDDQYGADQVTEALQFLNSPEEFRKSIEGDPKNYVTGPDGKPELTPEAKAKLLYMQSADFSNLVKKVNAKQATVGNDLMSTLGVDPVAHNKIYTIGAAGTDLAVSFAIDPTMIALKGVQAGKRAAVGIDTFGDSERAASLLTRDSKLPWVKNVQRGWQRGIDLADEFRAAKNANDTTGMAAATAKFRAELPGLEPLWENFTGGDRVYQGLSKTETVTNEFGKLVPAPIMEPSEGFHSLQDAADFVRSRYGLFRLYNGRAATQSSLMPGALSAFGYRKLKGATAGFMTVRSANRAEKAYQTVLSRAEADPALAKKLIDEKMLVSLMPETDDAVRLDGTVLAERNLEADPTLLPSQQRRLALTPAGKGDITANLRATGDPLGESTLGRLNPTAITARARLAAQRFTTMLPRNTRIDLNDPQAGDRIYRMALTYLNRGDANTLRALWNVGDAGQRKAIVGGLIDQLGHAAGLGRSESGQALMNQAKTAQEAYSAAGDEIELNGQRLALLEGQTRQTWTLPSFRDLQQNAAKMGLWDATMGRALTSDKADLLMGQWKMGALFKPSTFTRNWLEGWGRTALEGRLGDAVQARAFATTRNKELWDQGLGLDTTARAEYEAAVANGDQKLADQIANGSMLSGDRLGRSKYSTRLADLAPFAIAGRAYHALVGKTMDADLVGALATLGPDELGHFLEGYAQQALAGDLSFKHAAAEASQIAKDGYGPALIRTAVQRALSRKEAAESGPTVWSHEAVTGTLGADKYANALAQRVNQMPETAKAAIDVLEDPSMGLDHVVNAMEKEKKLTAFGTVFFEDPIGAPNVARRALNEDEVLAGKRDWAQKVVNEYGFLLTGQNGEFQTKLAKYIKQTGMAPDSNWIADHLVGESRPAHVLVPQTMAMPSGGIKSLPATLQDVEGGAYQWMVERMLQRTTTGPVFLANYAVARKGLNGEVERLVEAGVDRAAAENLAKELSVRQAWVKSEQMIDDPGQKTQFDVVARNFFPFSRATQAMIRRWGTGLWQNPAAARKMMLAYEGAVHSGMIYDNPYGEPTFTYPGSGVFGEVLQHLNQVPGFHGIAAFPVAGDMTGQVLMSVPGADNPFRMGMGPMVSIPLREAYKHLLPTSYQGEAEKLDAIVNGPIGVGETFSQLAPTAVRRFYQSFTASDRNSALVSSMNGAIANLSAAGLIPPVNASPSELQQFRARVQTQTQNQLFVRFALGLFAPASPSAPSEATPVSGADYAWSIDGVKQLSDEYRQILNEAGGDTGRANAIWTALHPDELVFDPEGNNTVRKLPSAYEVTKSKATAKGAYLPSTESSLRWLETNADFVKKYGSVAAYFVPEQATGEPFSDAAYRAQLEMGLRQRKTPEEFLNDIYVRHAESAFYSTLDKYDQRITAAKNAGDTAAESQWSSQKSDWEKQYKLLNPLFGAKLDEFGPARATALGQLSDVKRMLQDGDVPDGLAPKLRQLVTTYDNYVAFTGAHPGSDTKSIAIRSSALQTFNTWATQHLAGTPLVPLYNGVFRTLNSNLTALTAGGDS